ncbi:Hypothetical protein FKW44_012791 [Caligus rogercresseyi]|uniref:Uncharacterized protein n=1 Tax=Caligus rogercresseyi TaxID=217165 RepID=A0A7T8K9T0_CALRO|nr:Hypothetical protein FKW44_012791 [Caligus rogercresseyi]
MSWCLCHGPPCCNLPYLWIKTLPSFLDKLPGKWRTWQQVSNTEGLHWNVAGLSGTKELHLSCLLDRQDIDVAVITEIAPSVGTFKTIGYVSFGPLGVGKRRIVTLVKTDLAMRSNANLRPDLMSSDFKRCGLS